jgi:hypothetical protein
MRKVVVRTHLIYNILFMFLLVSGDGYDDIIIGAKSISTAYLIYGGANVVGTSGVFDLSSLDGSNGVAFYGAAYSDTGVSVSGAGDFNGTLDVIYVVLYNPYLYVV